MLSSIKDNYFNFKIINNSWLSLSTIISILIFITLTSCSNNNKTPQNSAIPNTSNTEIATKSNNPKTQVEVRIVSSKIGPLAVLRKQDTFKNDFVAKGYSVKWLELGGGPQQFEALNTGNLDITFAGESPSIFAQAAGMPIVNIATTNPNPKSVAFLVPNTSPIKNIADLKGKKVALQKASAVQYTLVKGLAEAGLKLSDIQPVYLPPPDANVAFSQQQVDAWVIWEPFITWTEEKGTGRILKDGEGLKDIGNFYTTSRKFAKEHPEFILLFLEEVQKAEAWSRDNPHEFASLMASELGTNAAAMEKVISKYKPGILPISDRVIAKQQEIADMYYQIGMLPKPIDVRQAFLLPHEYAALTPKPLTEKP